MRRLWANLAIAAFCAAMLAGPGAAVFPSTFRWAAWIACPAGSVPQPRTWPGLHPGERRAGFGCVTPDGQAHERTLAAAGGLWLMYFMGLSVLFSILSLRAAGRASSALRPDASAPLPSDLEAAVRHLLARDQLIHAIKLVRERTGMGLKEAKDWVEGVRDGTLVSPSSASPSAGAAQAGVLAAPAAFAGEVAPELVAGVRERIARDQAIAAVKLVREQTGVGLAEAKALVDAIQAGRIAVPAASGGALPASGRLEELKRMLDGGLITQAEYDAKKAEILAEL